MRSMLLCAVLVLVGCQGASEDRWQTITSEEGKFSIRFPGKPELQDDGDLSLKFKGGLFLVGHWNVDPKALATESPEEIFSKRLEGARSSREGGKLIASKDFKLNDRPARDADIEFPKFNFRVRLILAEKQIYQIVTAGSKEYVEGEDAVAFRASFRFVE